MELKRGVHRPKGMRILRFAQVAFVVAVLGALLMNGLVSCTGTEIPDPEDAINGVVKRPDGRPVNGARVIAWAKTGLVEQAESDTTLRSKDTVYSNATGRFTFKDKADGKYNLAGGKYNLYFEDAVSENKDRNLGRGEAYYDPSKTVPSVTGTLASPIELVLEVKYDTTETLIEGAMCRIIDSPYKKATGTGGVAVFYVPAGEYTVKCDSGYYSRVLTINVEPGSGVQQTVELFTGGKVQDPLPPPDSLSVIYNEYSGVADLSWPPVTDSRLFQYGVGRVNLDSGGGSVESITYRNYWPDVAFGPTDSVQQKNLQYSVNSLKRDPNGNGGSRRRYFRLTAQRPWAYGPRIDSIITLPGNSDYRAGDTIRFVGFWNNRMRENDTLYWWVQGGADLREFRVNPPAKGSDTLSVVLPAGEFKINLSIHDAEGYRSWLSIPFRM
jgi:hypothetical protein